MTNDTREGNKEDVVPCFALSKNDSYVMSASGGKISLFNMMTFKVPSMSELCLFICWATSFTFTHLVYFVYCTDNDNIHGASSSSNFSCLPSSRQ